MTQFAPPLRGRGRRCEAGRFGCAPRAFGEAILRTRVIRRNSNCVLSRSHGVVGYLARETMEPVAQESEMGEREVCEGLEATVLGCMLGVRTGTACWPSLLMVVGEPPCPCHGAPDHATSAPFP